MVFNWFEREASSSGETPSTPDSPAVEQQPLEDAVQVNPEPDPSALQDAGDQNGEGQDDEVQEEDEALVWAREAYARLKAQQQAAATAPKTPVSTTPEPEPEATSEPTAAVDPEIAAEPSSPVPLMPEVGPEPTPAPTVGGSLLEQAAAQRQPVSYTHLRAHET